MNIRPGMIIESVDGQAIAPGMDIAQALNRKAGKPVLLVVADGEKKTDVVAKPITLAEEGRAALRADGCAGTRKRSTG